MSPFDSAQGDRSVEAMACATTQNSLSAFGGQGFILLSFCNTFLKKYEREKARNRIEHFDSAQHRLRRNVDGCVKTPLSDASINSPRRTLSLTKSSQYHYSFLITPCHPEFFMTIGIKSTEG